MSFETFENVSDTFLELSQKELESYLSSDKLKMDSEKDKFEAVMRWIDCDTKNRRYRLSSLLPLIKLHEIDDNYLLEYVLNNGHKKYISHLLNGIMVNRFNRIIVVCYERIQIYNPAENVVEFECEVPYRGEFSPTLVGDKVVLVGIHKIRCFDLKKRTWHELAYNSDGRSFLKVETLNNYVYILGGIGNDGILRWDSKLNRLTNLGCMNRPLWNHCTAILNGKIYVIGGSTTIPLTQTNAVEYYDPITDKWSVCSPMLTARALAIAVVANGKIFVFGGYNRNIALNSIEMYNPVSNKWTKVSEMSEKKSSLGAYLLNNKIYLVGGQAENYRWLHSMEEFDPMTNECKLISPANIKYTSKGNILHCFPYLSKNKVVSRKIKKIHIGFVILVLIIYFLF